MVGCGTRIRRPGFETIRVEGSAVELSVATGDGQHYHYGEDNERLGWLAATIDDARESGMEWVIVGMHKSCLSIGPYHCAPYQDLWDLLVDRKVDLVLHGHEHNYQRTHQMATGPECAVVAVDTFDPECVVDEGADGLYRKGAGVVSVIAGARGGDLYDVDPADSEAGYFARWMAANASPRNGFLRVRVTSAAIEGEFVGTTRTSDFADRFEIR